MEKAYLYQRLPFLKDVKKDRREQFERYFQTAPLWLLDAFTVETLEKGVTFVRENDPADTIYLVAQGIVVATDYRVFGVAYDYMQFKNVYAFGGMEFLMDLEEYKTSLRTVTRCTIVKIPRAVFEKWMYADIHALKYEAKLVGEYLLEQARNERSLLLMQGADRLALLFVDYFEQYGQGGVLWVREGQKSLADKTGFCLKSVNRALEGQKMYDKLLTCRNPIKEKIVLGGMHVLGCYDILEGQVMREKANPSCRESTTRLMELYQKALDETPAILENLYQCLYGTGTTLSSRFLRDYH